MVETLHETVTRAAAQRGDACAFRCGSDSISYSELERASQQLASFLVQHGLKRGDRVGVYMPRSVATAVAAYAAMKAGGIFVPMDPHLPAGAVEQLVRDGGIRHLLTHPDKTGRVRDVSAADTPLTCVIGVDTQLADFPSTVFACGWDAWKDLPLTELPKVTSEDAAYIMYSSGSTGRSKGITHTHRSGLAYCRLSAATYEVTARDVIANHSPINFDMSTFGYFVSCYAGATCVLVPEAHTKFPSSLAKLIEQERISIWYSVPLALVQLLLRAQLEDHDLSCLRWVKFGGECFPPKYLKALMRQWPQARFSNVYGPAEVNQCTYYHVPASYADDPAHDQIPIGRIWDESDGLVVDDRDQVITGDAIGELVVATPTMMNGYWGRRPEDTPVFEHDSRTYYRTGDLVQRREDGELLFLGRKDRQVKVRGYRVELDDVERAISSHADVEESAVFCVVRDDEKQIWSTVIPKPGGEVEPEGLRRFLLGFISQYAVPTKIDVVQQFPRTSSGKIDRRELQREAQAAS